MLITKFTAANPPLSSYDLIGSHANAASVSVLLVRRRFVGCLGSVLNKTLVWDLSMLSAKLFDAESSKKYSFPTIKPYTSYWVSLMPDASTLEYCVSKFMLRYSE